MTTSEIQPIIISEDEHLALIEATELDRTRQVSTSFGNVVRLHNPQRWQLLILAEMRGVPVPGSMKESV